MYCINKSSFIAFGLLDSSLGVPESGKSVSEACKGMYYVIILIIYSLLHYCISVLLLKDARLV